MTENHEYHAKLEVLAYMGNRLFRKVHVELARKIGILEAYLLWDLIDEFSYFESENKLTCVEDFGDCFFYDHKKCDERLAMGEKQMLRIVKSLVDQKLIEYQVIGLPGKRHFKINFSRVSEISKNVSIIPKRESYNSQTGTIEIPNGNPYTRSYTESKNNDDDDRVREASPLPEKKTETPIKPHSGPTDLKGAPLIIDESELWKHMLKFPDIPNHIIEESIHKLKNQSIPITCPKRYIESVCKNLIQIEKNEALRIKSYGDKNKKKEDKKKEDTHPVIKQRPLITWAEAKELLKQQEENKGSDNVQL